MHRITKFTAVVLVGFYLAYALSPLCASLSDGDNGMSAMKSREDVTVGILWVGIMLDVCLDQDGADRTQEMLAAADDDDLIFVKKRRAISRKRHDAKPVLQTEVLAPEHEAQPEFSYRDFDISLDLIHQQADGYYALSTGLSPPLLLS